MGKSSSKERILSAAIDLMSELGYEAVTMRMIADSVGLRVASIYNHYSSKEEIFHRILEYTSQFFAANMQYPPEKLDELLLDHPPEEIIRDYISYYMPSDYGQLVRLLRLLFMEQYANPLLREISFQYFFTETKATLKHVVDAFARRSLIPATDYKALTFVVDRTSLLFGFMATHFHLDTPNERYFLMNEFYITCIRRGVRPITGCGASFTMESCPAVFTDRAKAGIPTRQRIIHTTYDLLEQYGSDRVSMRMICDEVGIQVGSAYAHFTGKDEIIDELSTVMVRACQPFGLDQAEIKKAFRSGEVDRIVGALSQCNPDLRMESQYKTYRVICRELYYNKQFRDFYWSALQADLQALAQALDELAAEGAIPPCEGWKLATLYIFTMATVNIGCTIFQRERELMEEHRRTAGLWILGLMLNGFGG